MKKVVLVYPRNPDVFEHGMSCPLGIQYLASYLKKNNVDVDVIDMTFMRWDEYEDKIKRMSPEFIGFSIQTPIAEQGMKAIMIARRVLPKSKIIVGGSHATVATESLLENNDIDFVITGEGEKVLLDIVRGHRKDGVIHGEPIASLDDIPFPQRDMMDYQKYIGMTHSIEIMVSRGCPYNCMFCQPTQRRLFGDKVRIRSPENVIDEMQQLIHKYGSDLIFYFLDDTFTWDKEWLQRFCVMIKKLGVKWKCSTRVDAIDEEKIRMIKNSGCVFINYGVESGSQKILDFMRKGITKEQIRKAFKLTHKYGMLCMAFIIIGTPTETKEDLEETVKIVRQIRPDGLQVSIMTPLPGTDLEKHCIEKGISNINRLSQYNYCDNEYPIRLEHLTSNDLKHYRKKIIDTMKRGRYMNCFKYMKMLLNPSVSSIFYNAFLRNLIS